MAQKILYRDGVTDDTEAFQAWIDGEDVYTPTGELLPDHLESVVVLITAPLKIENPYRTVNGLYIARKPNPVAGAYFSKEVGVLDASIIS